MLRELPSHFPGLLGGLVGTCLGSVLLIDALGNIFRFLLNPAFKLDRFILARSGPST